VAAPPATYDDLVGESWEDAKQTLVELRQRTLLHNIFSQMQARSQPNPSLLISGPRGCGKSLFVDAVMADPKVVAVRVSTHDILSPYPGQSERRLSELLEQCATMVLEHEKPAVLLWDNVDTLYAPNHTRPIRLQKMLADALQGNPLYKGVGIIALSDSSRKIPSTLRHSFTQQLEIKPLTNEERRTTMMHLLDGLPLAPHFKKTVAWEDFDTKTIDANGAILRKISDTVFLDFLKSIAEKHGNSTVAKMNGLVGERCGEAPLTPEARRELFRSVAPDTEVSPQAFHDACRKVLESEAAQDSTRQDSHFDTDADGTDYDPLDDEDDL
jgi:SpoVK/Ycf46/Vps4 family AAA+-type ATPase